MTKLVRALVIILLCSYGQSKPSDRIVGGTDTTVEQYPYVVSLQYFDNHLCGASVLSKYWLLTAAHCFGSGELLMPFLSARVGSSFHREGGARHFAKGFIRHENFTRETYDFDIAIVELLEPLEFSDVVQPINLPSQDYELEGPELTTVLGWGRTETGGSLSDQLQEADLLTIPYNNCSAIYGSSLTTRMICASDWIDGRDACHADSGGPLVSKDQGSTPSAHVQVGVVSWGPENICSSPIYPGVYTKVATFVDWITFNMGNTTFIV